MKYIVAIAALLLLVSCAPTSAQQLRSSSNMPSYTGGGGGYASSGPFTSGFGSSGFGGFSGFSSSAGSPVVWESPREFMLLYGRNDGPFVPSTFMKYEDALQLGRELLKQLEADAATSFADTARKAQADKAPSFRLKTRVVQDNTGKLQLCNLNGNDCHRI